MPAKRPPPSRGPSKAKASAKTSAKTSAKASQKANAEVHSPAQASGKATRPHKPAAAKRGWIRSTAYWLTVLFLWAGIGVGGVVFYYALDLPDTDQLWQVESRPELKFYGLEGKLLARRGRLAGRPILFEDLPPHLVNAVVAIEDRRFFDHFGIDFWGLGRATLANLTAGGVVAGGSTLTQQLAKNVFLSPDRTIKRKVQELLLAFWLEATLSKQEIFALYMNRVYFGAGAYGIHAAAQIYFDRPVQELTLGESAILAGLLKAPSRLAPNRNPQAAYERAALVLQAMADMKTISLDRLTSDPLSEVRVVTRSSDTAHYAIDWATDRLPDFIGRPRADLDIVTTIDPALQLAAERAARAIIDQYGAERDVSQVAMVVMTPQGAIRAMVGGYSYADSQFNRAVLAYRQPGSAFKPIVFLAGLEAGLTPLTLMTDAPIDIEGWSPSNYDDAYRGDMTLTEAFAHSINTIAAQVSEKAGRQNVIDVAHRLGVVSELVPLPSIALGAQEVNLLELTTAYATIANGGYRTFPHVIDEVVSYGGTELYKRQAGAALPVADPKNIAALKDMLVTAVERGTGRAAAIQGLRVGGKTGTTQNWRDAWFIGMAGDLVAGVWVGNDDGHVMNKVTGGFMPARIWHDFMAESSVIQPMAPLSGGTSKPKARGLFDWLFGD